MSLALSTCVSFILLMQSVNRGKLSNITYLLLLPSPAASATTDIFPLTSIYASL